MRHNLLLLGFVTISLFLLMVLPGLVSADKPAQSSTLTPISIPSITANKQWTPIIQGFDGVEMVQVPPGCFMMGSSDKQVQQAVAQYVKEDLADWIAKEWTSKEQPQTKVCFDKLFWLDKTEVTQGQFKRFDGIAVHKPEFTGSQRPVEDITWFEARDFCAKRGARLPTEAEWEYAARGPDGLVYPWGNVFIRNNAVYLVDPEWRRGTASVGSIEDSDSWVGALDLIGNVAEWMNSLEKAYPYDARDGRENMADLTNVRVLRGAAWNDSISANLRAAARRSAMQSEWGGSIGFRCARSG